MRRTCPGSWQEPGTLLVRTQTDELRALRCAQLTRRARRAKLRASARSFVRLLVRRTHGMPPLAGGSVRTASGQHARVHARMLRRRVRVCANSTRARALFVRSRSPRAAVPAGAGTAGLVRESLSARSNTRCLRQRVLRTRSSAYAARALKCAWLLAPSLSSAASGRHREGRRSTSGYHGARATARAP